MNKDLTIGKPTTILWKFCMPLFASVIFQQLYNLTDNFVAGKFVGENALAAVGNSYEITLIYMAFAFGCNMGCSVIVSQLFGAKKYSAMKTAIYTTLIASGVICVILMAVGLYFCTNLLQYINTPDNIIADSALYLKIYTSGLPFIFFYNIATGIFSAMGDSKTPFIFLMASSLANIGMDILFVTVLSPIFVRGVDGVAWATFLCQGVSGVLAIVCIFRRLRKIETSEKTMIFSWKMLASIAVIAIPSILQQGFISVGNIVIQGVINTFGSSVVAGYSAAIKLNNLVITSLTTIGNGISNFTAQNIGAQKLYRVRSGFRAGVKMVWTLCVPIFLLYFFAGKYLIYIFLDSPTGTAMETGIQFLQIVSPFYFVISVGLVLDGILRGSKMMNKFMIVTLTDLILRAILAKLLSVPLGATGIWMAWPIGWIVSIILSVAFYRTGNWNDDSEEKIHKN